MKNKREKEKKIVTEIIHYYMTKVTSENNIDIMNILYNTIISILASYSMNIKNETKEEIAIDEVYQYMLADLMNKLLKNQKRIQDLLIKSKEVNDGHILFKWIFRK